MQKEPKELITLGIETSTHNLSIGLVYGNNVIGLSEIKSKSHDSHIIPIIQSLLDKANISKSDIGLISVDCGPGAFTSIRVGVSCARALSQFGNYPIVSVSSLDTIKANIDEIITKDDGKLKDPFILSVIDAKQNKLYASLYHKNKTIEDKLYLEPALLIDKIKNTLSNKPLFILGSAVKIYADIFKRELRYNKILSDYYNYPHGHNVALIGKKLFERGNSVSHNLITPFYVNKVF